MLTLDTGSKTNIPGFGDQKADRNDHLGNYFFDTDYDLSIQWGSNKGLTGTAGIYSEFGFFRDAIWFDKLGIYQESSLNQNSVLAEIEKFKPPVDLIPHLLKSDMQSKYPQPSDQHTDYEKVWDGDVIALQMPSDKAVLAVGTEEDYYRWIGYMSECEIKYKYFKLHPHMKSRQDQFEKIRSILHKKGCYFGYAGLDILENCSVVDTYNSSFVIDCWMRNIKTYMHKKGTFERLDLLTNIDDEKIFKKKIVHFLMWKYCVPASLDLEQLKNLFRIYKESDSMFPMPLEYSWGHWFSNKLCKEQKI